jgi:uncharacterized protein (TIGR00369 family)
MAGSTKNPSFLVPHTHERFFVSLRGSGNPILERHWMIMADSKTFETRDPEFQAKVRDSFERQGLMKHLGAQLSELRPGHCEIRVPFRDELSQQHGYFHAGVTGAIADSAAGYPAFSLMPPGCSALSVEYKLNLLAPAQGQLLIARAQVIRSGRTLTVARADVFVVKDGVEDLCATFLSTIMVLAGKLDR